MPSAMRSDAALMVLCVWSTLTDRAVRGSLLVPHVAFCASESLGTKVFADLDAGETLICSAGDCEMTTARGFCLEKAGGGGR